MGPTTVGWEEGIPGFDDIPIPNAAATPQGGTRNIPGLIGLAVLDLDGDGRDDINLWGILGANGYRLSVANGFTGAQPGVGVGRVQPTDLFMGDQHEPLAEAGCGAPQPSDFRCTRL